MAVIDPDPVRLRRRVAALGALLWLAAAMPLSAEGFEVRVVASTGTATHEALLAAMRDALGAPGRAALVLRVQSPEDYRRTAAATGPVPDLVVSIGAVAAEAVARTPPPAPVLFAFVPHPLYERLREHHARTATMPASALYLDQPPRRQLRLLRLALPQLRRVGVVLGPDSQREAGPLGVAAAGAGLVLEIETVREERELVTALQRLLGRVDALLAVPDRVASSRHAVPAVLLTAYRHGKPVMGYSAAYVGAGALLAVYSTPEQLGRQLAELLAAMAVNGVPLPPPQYPRYFSVEVNARVARALGLAVAPAPQLAQRLAEAEDSGP